MDKNLEPYELEQTNERAYARMMSRKARGVALSNAIKAALDTAGNPSTLSGTRIPSTMVERDRTIAPQHQFPVYHKLPREAPRDEL